MRDTFQIELSLRQFFEALTIAKISDLIKANETSADEPVLTIVPISRVSYRAHQKSLKANMITSES
jgi:hypothetical protein